MLKKIDKVLDKYLEANDNEYDFEDTRNNIKLTFEHLKLEKEELEDRDHQTSWLITILGVLVGYSPVIAKFAIDNSSTKVDIIVITIYGLCLVYSLICVIEFMYPRQRTQLNPPRVFYDQLLNQYRADDDISDDQVSAYVRANYLSHLSKCLDDLQKCNVIKAKWRYRAYVSFVVTAIPYLICISRCLIFK